MSLSRQSTTLNRLAPLSTRSTRAAVSSDWSVPLRMRANTWYHKHTFSPRQYLSLTFVTWQSWWDKVSILERLALMFSLMLCTVHSWTTLLVTTRTDAISVRMESVWPVSSLREDDLQKKKRIIRLPVDNWVVPQSSSHSLHQRHYTLHSRAKLCVTHSQGRPSQLISGLLNKLEWDLTTMYIVNKHCVCIN